MRVALVHDWLTGMRGGEKILEVFCELFPDATIYATIHNEGMMSPVIERMKIRTSFIQHLPLKAKKYRNYLPLMPAAVNALDFSDYDFILSTSVAVAKAAKPRKGATHICYCNTPMRYILERGAPDWLLARPCHLQLRIFASGMCAHVIVYIISLLILVMLPNVFLVFIIGHQMLSIRLSVPICFPSQKRMMDTI